MTFTAPQRAGEVRPRSKPTERLNMARSLLRPRLLEAGLISSADFNAGYEDAFAGKPWRLTPADLIARQGDTEALSYMLGYRAGELARRSGGGAEDELAGRPREG